MYEILSVIEEASRLIITSHQNRKNEDKMQLGLIYEFFFFFWGGGEILIYEFTYHIERGFRFSQKKNIERVLQFE